MICCTFAGHREVIHKGVEERVYAMLSDLLTKDSEFLFYVGGMGEFDALCAHVVRKLKKAHPEKRMQLVLVEPYMKQSINTSRDYLRLSYDEVIIPDALAGIHYKRAIACRNRWMVDHSQYIISYLYRDHGGVYETIRYAEQHNTIILRIPI